MTLDQALDGLVQLTSGEKLDEIMDPGAWNKGTRDELFAKVKDLNQTSVKASIQLISQYCKEEFEGKPILEWYIAQSALQTLYQLLTELRSEVDYMTAEELSDYPFDYDWLNPRIREVCKELRDISAKINMSEYMKKEVVEEL